MERGISNSLQGWHRLSNQGRFIKAGGANINIQNMRSNINLLQTKTAYIVQILSSQGFLQALFTGGINALANDNGALAQMHSATITGNSGELAVAVTARLQILTFFNHSLNMGRSGAAATTHNAGALLSQLIHKLSILFRTNLKAGFAVLFYWQTCVGIDDHGQASRCQHLGQKLGHLDGA